MTSEEARDILGLGNVYGDEDVNTAFRKLSKQCHPDKGCTAGLFRLLSQAREALLRSPGQGPKTQAKQTTREPDWNPFQDPGYVCPWYDFRRIIAGDTVPLFKHGRPFIVRRDMLKTNWLHTTTPVVVEIRLWRNQFSRLFCRPMEVITKNAAFTNNSSGSFAFDLALSLMVGHGPKDYFELQVKAPWAENGTLFEQKGSCKAACCSSPTVQRKELNGLSFELTTKFTAQNT